MEAVPLELLGARGRSAVTLESAGVRVRTVPWESAPSKARLETIQQMPLLVPEGLSARREML